jgi:hypothetical protein
VALGVQMAQGDGCMIATCLLASFGVSTVDHCVSSFPDDEERFPLGRDDICGPESAGFEIGLSFEVP